MADHVTTLATTQPRAMAAPLEFSPEQQKMIRDTFANGAEPAEFAVLMEVAKARRLNPLLRQIYFVQRWDSQKRCMVWSTQISIDGLRAVAERTGVYAGQDEPEYEHDPKTNALRCCKVKVYRKDWPRPAVGVAYFDEYAQTKKDGGLTQFWATKPHVMLAKCAEALAIRKAFPEDTGGLYTAEEMGAEPAVDVAPAPREEPKPAPRAPPAREPVVIPEVVDPTPEEKQAARNIVEAAATLQAEIVPSPQDLAARRLALYNRATSPRGANMPKGSVGRWVESVLGRHVASTKDWTPADMDRLEADLERMDSLPDEQPSMQ